MECLVWHGRDNIIGVVKKGSHSKIFKFFSSNVLTKNKLDFSAYWHHYKLVPSFGNLLSSLPSFWYLLHFFLLNQLRIFDNTKAWPESRKCSILPMDLIQKYQILLLLARRDNQILVLNLSICYLKNKIGFRWSTVVVG